VVVAIIRLLVEHIITDRIHLLIVVVPIHLFIILHIIRRPAIPHIRSDVQKCLAARSGGRLLPLRKHLLDAER
jgi:hypothetical protein